MFYVTWNDIGIWSISKYRNIGNLWVSVYRYRHIIKYRYLYRYRQ